MNNATPKENRAIGLFLLHHNNPCVTISTPSNSSIIFIAVLINPLIVMTPNIIISIEQMKPIIMDAFSYNFTF